MKQLHKGFTLKDIESDHGIASRFYSSATVKQCNPLSSSVSDPYPVQLSSTDHYKKLLRLEGPKEPSFLSPFDKQQKRMMQRIIDEEYAAIYDRMFKLITPIRKEDMVYNIKHLAILKYRREKKFLQGQADPAELLDYIKKKNQIQIYIQAAKKITDLQGVAELIEAQITQ